MLSSKIRERDNNNIGLDNRDDVAVNRLAIEYAIPAFKLQVRLTSLAKRIDPVAVENGAPWDRLILLIAAEFHEHAADLVESWVPVLKELNWQMAPQGSLLNGRVEALSMDDAERFKCHAARVLQVLDAIDETLG